MHSPEATADSEEGPRGGGPAVRKISCGKVESKRKMDFTGGNVETLCS